MAKIKLRRDTAANWLSSNPVMALGEPGYDTTNNKLKIGDSTSTWTQLTFLTDAAGVDGTYSPTTPADWIGSPTVGTVVSGLDELAGRVTVVEGTVPNQSLNTTDSVTFNEITSTTLVQNSSRTASPNSVNVLGSTSTVVFSTPSYFTSIKLVIAVEGQLDGDGTFVDHTQTCEATIAATYNTSAEPIMSVYGIVYTSPTPLATFTVARNGLTGNIEVTAVNSQATNGLNVRVHTIQFVSRYD